MPGTWWAVLALSLFITAIAARTLGAPDWSGEVAYAACYVAGGWQTGWASLRALRVGVLSVDLLVSLAAVAAAAIGRVSDGAMLIVVFSASRALRYWSARNGAPEQDAAEQTGRTGYCVLSSLENLQKRCSVGVVVAAPVMFAVALLRGEDLDAALLRAVTFMVVASPGALALTAAAPMAAAITSTDRGRVLVTSARVMDRLATVDTVVLHHKSGMLTQGVPTLVATVAVDERWTDDDVLEIAAAAESCSEHRSARAVAAAAGARGLCPADVDASLAGPGCGVHASVDGRWVQVTSPTMILNGDDENDALRMLVDVLASAGNTPVAVIVDGRAVGVLAIQDEVRPDALADVAALSRHLDRAPTLLTGDTRRAAQQVGNAVGIWDVRAELLPEAKVEAIAAVREYGTVLVVGDVGDAVALATADVGVVVSRHGADSTGKALKTVGVEVVIDDFHALPDLLHLARRVRRTIVVNLVTVATVIAGLVIWNLFGHLDLLLGVAVHAGIAVFVGVNGLRFLGVGDLDVRQSLDHPTPISDEPRAGDPSHARVPPVDSIVTHKRHGPIRRSRSG